MFWTDLYLNSIQRAHLDGSNMTTIISTDLSSPGMGVAVGVVLMLGGVVNGEL